MSDSISDSISTTGRVTVGSSVAGEIETPNDRDAYAVELVAGRTYRIDLEGTATDEGTLADPLLRWLRDETGTGLVGTRDDNGGEGANARQTFTPEVSGTYYISARGKGDGVGTYTLTVTDISPPEPPVFGASAYAFDLAENAAGSTDRVSLGTLSATDPEGTTLSYSLAGGNESGSFEIDAQTGELFYAGSGEDYETGTTRFTLTVRASDGSETADVTVTVHVTDVNEAPAFGQEGYTFALAENADGSTDRVSLGTVGATDPEGVTLAYSLIGDSGSFEIDETSGELFYTGSGEDYETGTTRFTLTVRASDGSETTDVTVTVNVTDENETPSFAEASYAFDLAENADGSTNRISLGTIAATDPEGVSLAYSLVGDSSSFEIDETSGELFYTGSGEDYETGTTRFTLTVRASDGSETADVTVTVHVTDVNEAPAFGQEGYTFALAENADGSTDRVSLGTVGATDPEGVTLAYSLIGDSGSFEIDETSGELFYTGSGEDYETGTTRFTLTVRASDGSETTDSTVTVNVTDVEETVDPPATDEDQTALQTVSEPDGEDFSQNELTSGRVAVGETATGDIGAQRDRDWFAVDLVAGREYQIDLRGRPTGDGTLSDPRLYGVHDADGNLIAFTANDDWGGTYNSQVTLTAPASGTHYIAAGAYGTNLGTYTLEVTDKSPADTGSQSDTTTVVTTNEAPSFAQASYAFNLGENADGSTDRVSLGTVAATDPEGATLSYSLAGGNESGSFEIDETSGELFYTGSGEDYESGTTRFTLTVRASDGSETTDSTVTVNVTDVEETVDPPATDEDQTALQTVSEPDGEDFSQNELTSGRVAVGETATGDIGAQRDRDWFAVDLVAGREYQIDLRGRPTGDGTLSDPRLYGVHDADGNLIAFTANDDWGGTYNSQVTLTAPASGTHYIAAGAFGTNLGTYTLEVTDNSQPDVQVPGAQGTSALPMIQVADAEATEGDDTWIVFRVTLDRAASGPVTVSYTTADGTAQARTDYLEAYGTLTFAAGETEKTVRVAIINDAVEDSGETFRLVLSNPTGAQLADAEAVGTILNAERADDYAADTTTTGTVSVGSTQTGDLESAGDADWLKVTLVGGTRYIIDYEGAETNRGTLFDPYLRGVYDANGNLISGTTDDNGGQGFNSRLDFTPDTSGTYFIGLQTTSPYLPGGTYRVRVTEFDDYAIEVHIPDDDYEDNTTTEGSVSVGGSAVGNYQQAISNDADWIRPTVETFWTYFDHDWFRVTFDEDTTYRIEIKGSWTDHGTLRDTRIAGIYDSNGNLIDGTVDDNSGIDVEARTIFTAPTAGTYYIAATRGERPFPTQNSGTYTVEVAEVGNDDYAADTTTSGSVEVDGSTTATIERLGDLDWFAVTLEGYATYRFDLEGIGDDWRLLEGKFIRGIYDSNGDLVAGSYTGEDRDGEVQAVFTPEQDGTYYVAVGARETFTGTGEYRLSATKFIPEFSDWLDTEGRIAAGFTVAGAIEAPNDKDWFRVTLEADKTYQIDLEGSPTNRGTLRDPYLHGVYDAEGDLIWYTSDADSGVSVNSRVTFTPDTDGTYYVAAGTLFGQTGTYELSVDEMM